MISSRAIALQLLCALYVCCTIVSGACPTAPFEGARRTGDNGYRLVFSEDVVKYVPGRIYNRKMMDKAIVVILINPSPIQSVFLLGSSTPNQHPYHRFSVKAQSATGPTVHSVQQRPASPRRVGRFQLFSDVQAKFDEHCVNRVTESNAGAAKTETQLMWVAPKTGSGCVAISAAVWTSGDSGAAVGRWYADEGQLMRVVCETTAADQAAEVAKAQASNGMAECCACDEAKYNVRFICHVTALSKFNRLIVIMI